MTEGNLISSTKFVHLDNQRTDRTSAMPLTQYKSPSRKFLTSPDTRQIENSRITANEKLFRPSAGSGTISCFALSSWRYV